MTSRRHPLAPLWLALLAFGGLLGGHALSYFAVAPDGHTRAELLRATGHGSHDFFVTWGLAAAAAGFIGIIGAHLRSGWESGCREHSIPRTGSLLWVMQTAGFVLLEATERGYGLHDLGELLHEPGFLLGLVAQAVVALVAAGLVFLLRASVDAIRRLLAAPEGAATVRPQRLPAFYAFASSVARAAWNLRGPPVSADHQG